MHDFDPIANRGLVVSARQPGLVGIEVDRHPATSLRRQFSDVSPAAHLLALEEVHNRAVNSNSDTWELMILMSLRFGVRDDT
jgi:hypothetical protein